MSIGLCFWILMLVTLVLGVRQNWSNLKGAGGDGLLFLILLLLGWKVFGAPIQS